MIRLLILLIAIPGMYSYSPGFCKPLSNNHTNSISLDTSNFVIIKFNSSFQWIFKDVKPTNLTIKEIELVDKLLNNGVFEYNKQIQIGNCAIKPLLSYKRQYVPVVNSKGEKEVWINCLCEIQGRRWRKEIILVDDGGSCYFNLKVNLSTKRSYPLAVNGEG